MHIFMISVLGSFGILVLKLSQRASKAMNIFGQLLDKRSTSFFSCTFLSNDILLGLLVVIEITAFTPRCWTLKIMAPG